ncbi:MAG: hypothetical protein FH761_02360 [Firmicutes bacterium]|nr:hypothetical protein [Bacillota bacterium]
MKLKINNIQQEDGYIDYKGLDMKSFKPGSQRYKMDGSYCVLETKETDLPDTPDITIINDTEYEILRQEIENEKNQYKSKEQEQIDELTLQLGDALLGGAL